MKKNFRRKKRETMSEKEFDKYIEDIMYGEYEEEPEDDVIAPEDETKPAQEEVKKPFKSFDTEEEYKAEIDKIMSEKDLGYEKVKAQRDELIENLKAFYETDDAEEAAKLFSEQISGQKAAAKGMTPDEYKADEENKRKIKAYDMMEAERKKIADIREKLFAEEGRIKETDKDFDLQKVYNEDEQFKADLKASDSVFFAYANYVRRKSQKTQDAPKKKERSFHEEASTTTTSGGVKSSAMNLPDKEFDKYISDIMGGSGW